MRSRLGLALLLAAGCDGPPLALPDFAVARDLSAAVDAAADLAERPRDLSVPDLAPRDAAVPDLAVKPDIAMPDLLGSDADGPPCSGGFLAGGGCPLGCSAAVRPVPDEGAFHVPYCTPVQYVANPPASGNHWPWHADWGVSTEVIQREYWVHCLEHGGVILLYNCPPAPNNFTSVYDGGNAPYECSDGGAPPPPNNCAQDIQTLANIIKAQKPDQFGIVRMLLTPDPKLPTKFAAVAWDWVWTGDTVDAKAIQCFVDARLDWGPENAP